MRSQSPRQLVAEAALNGPINLIDIARKWKPITCPSGRETCPDEDPDCGFGVLMALYASVRHILGRHGQSPGLARIKLPFSSLPSESVALKFILALRAEVGLKSNRKKIARIVHAAIIANDDTRLDDRARSEKTWGIIGRLLPKKGLNGLYCVQKKKSKRAKRTATQMATTPTAKRSRRRKTATAWVPVNALNGPAGVPCPV